ncbi:MAG TPA: aminopeptidase [Bacteroidales bacterium]|nr:MAG: aminopeptidase [Bacteroidetes bacterium GWF2_33_38]OFY74931.1 MAG: aminopeptidase [Bacteroidetes bacterium RIFOXYA12_FULL_33_9]OFY90842.1 MAG: aminopeptidase [Bacteroidetes bacterium RIFOXYA2_FULL_33_7]HBF89490.1 aminopeptidase [Bacteroidales bacterium]
MKLRNLISSLILSFVIFQPSFAQEDVKQTTDEKKGYQFTIDKQLATTSVKDQYRSGTCWSFSGISFLESELIRLKKGEFDLSEMYIVKKSYEDKAQRYVRMHGALNFGGGGALNDILNVIKIHGIMTEEAYSGLVIGEEGHIHGEMDGVCEAMVKEVINNKNQKLTPNWFEAFKGLTNAYLGKEPEKFNYKGKEYTARTFADEVIGLNTNDYILMSSFTHHPFYEKFILEVPDNWSWGEVYNVQMDELIKTIDNAINNGYTVAWAGDVSEKGFNWKKGVAVVPEKDIESMSDLERAKWDELSQKEKDEQLYSFDEAGKEKIITQELRQAAFDNFTTTDDHGMHIVGIAKDQNGTKFYLVKNSWNTKGNPYNGYLYMSESFIKYKTMSMMINKASLPSDIAKKLKL